MKLKREGRVSIREAFPGSRAALFDLDGTLAETETAQKIAWKRGVRRHLQQHVQVAVECTEQIGSVLVRAETHIDWCFDRGTFNVFAPGLFDILKPFLPAYIADSKECDRFLSQIRAGILQQMLKDGEIMPVRGAQKLLESLAQAGMRRGLYTNSPKDVAMPTLNHLFGPQFESLIPLTNRLFGDNVPDDSKKKPHAWGWRVLAGSKLGTSPTHAVIVEDRPSSIAGALRVKKNRFAGAIGVVGSGPLEPWQKELAGFGERVVLVEDLSQVAA